MLENAGGARECKRMLQDAGECWRVLGDGVKTL